MGDLDCRAAVDEVLELERRGDKLSSINDVGLLYWRCEECVLKCCLSSAVGLHGFACPRMLGSIGLAGEGVLVLLLSAA